MDTREPVIAKQSCFFAVLSGLVNVVNSVIDVVLMVWFWVHGDIVWASCYSVCIGLSTLYNLVVSLFDHPGFWSFTFWAGLSILQLKAWGDTLEYLSHPQLGGDGAISETERLLKDYRSKKFFTSVIQALPIAFLLTYILMLDLEGRVNERLLSLSLFLSFTSFAMGTASFAACNETIVMGGVVFIQALAQFSFRMLAVCAFCVRFKQLGMMAMGVFWVFVYLMGPQGTLDLFYDWLRGNNNEHDKLLQNILLKIFLTPLSFFIVINAYYQNDQTPSEPLKAYHHFRATGFMLWRMFENVVLVVCFVFIPKEAVEGARNPDEYEEWLDHPINIAIISALSLFLVLSTWLVIVKSEPADPATYKLTS